MIIRVWAAAMLLAAAGGTNSSQQQMFEQVYTQYVTALQHSDTAALQRILDDRFTQETAEGASVNKASFIQMAVSQAAQTPNARATAHVQTVSISGSTARVRVQLAVDAPPWRGVETDEDVWTRDGSQWHLLKSAQKHIQSWKGATLLIDDVQPVQLSAKTRANVLAQINRLMIPIRTAVPDGNLNDLAPLKSSIGNARIIAMGEATHGTSEFFSLKDRLFRYLVEHDGVTVFAMEANWSDGLAIDKYVTTGQGDIKAALASTFAVWDNQEVLDLLDWMRAYNAAPGNHPTLHFFGIDMQSPATADEMVAAYFKSAHPDRAAAVESQIACMDLSIGTIYQQYLKKPQSERDACKRSTAAVAQSLPADAPLDIVHAAQVVEQAASMYAAGMDGEGTGRDSAMADNLAWAAQKLYPHAKIALWAHDGHVQAADAQWPNMGGRLRERFGSEYYVIGFAFDHGTVSPNGVSPNITIAPAQPTAMESVLRDARVPMYALDLHAAAKNTPLRQWLDRKEPMQELGAVTDPAQIAQRWILVTPAKAFDTLIFVADSHAAHSFQQNELVRKTITLTAGAGGLSLSKWMLSSDKRVDANVTTDQVHLHGSSASIVLTANRASETNYTILGGGQSAQAFLGKRVRVTGYLRTSNAGAAGFWLRVDTAKGVAGLDNMLNRPITGTADWTPFSIVLEVPDDAKDLAFGLLLRGSGSVWTDGVKFEAVGNDVPATNMAPSKN